MPLKYGATLLLIASDSGLNKPLNTLRIQTKDKTDAAKETKISHCIMWFSNIPYEFPREKEGSAGNGDGG